MMLRRQSQDRVGPAERSRSWKRLGTPWRIKVLARTGFVARAGFVRAGFVRADLVRTSTGVAAMTEADLGACGQGRGV